MNLNGDSNNFFLSFPLAGAEAFSMSIFPAGKSTREENLPQILSGKAFVKSQKEPNSPHISNTFEKKQDEQDRKRQDMQDEEIDIYVHKKLNQNVL